MRWFLAFLKANLVDINVKKLRIYPTDIEVTEKVFVNGRKTGPRQLSLFSDARKVCMGNNRICL